MIGLYRLLTLVGLIALLEILSALRVIDPFTMPPPHQILEDLIDLLASGRVNEAILNTYRKAGLAFVLAVVAGVASATALHGFPALRRALDPFFATYYAVPIFGLYPLMIILFGLTDTPQVAIGYMLGVVAVTVNTLNGLDRVPPVLRKTGRVMRMSPFEVAMRITLPSALPYVLTGTKFALAYSLIGVIGAEFIMSRGGMGYEISFSYNNFDNATMYPLIVVIVTVAITLNLLLSAWEQRILSVRGQR